MNILPIPFGDFNTQPPEARDFSNGGGLLQVHSIFHTIQGEGIYAGVPSVFVRLAGCNLQCPGCDTEYTQGRMVTPINSILERIGDLFPETPFERPRLVVITGGEPLRQNISPLCHALLSLGAMIQVETNGTYNPPPSFPSQVKIVCSPKASRVAPALLGHISAYKYVLQAGRVNPNDGLPNSILGKDDLAPARPHPAFEGPVYISPMDEQNKELNQANLEAAVKICLRFGYIFNLQLHKLLGLP